MPPQQGEVSLLTLFADIHYYLSPPSQKPPHHRFDKGSYVYLYHNPIRQSGRIEIANHAGTPDQDAFAGQLDTVRVDHTYKHACLFTLTVDGFPSQSGSPAASPHQDASQWHLPTPDPANQGKYMYRLHTVDMYFWTPEDASLFQDSLRRVMQPHQLQIVRNPNATPIHSEHKNDALSPVIARLESAAISHASRSPSISSTQAFPGPPTAPAPASSPPAGQPGYAPMAYNPAAPAAPEPIAHREKTPPPPDVEDGTGLGASAGQDHHASHYNNPLQASFVPQPTSGPYTPGPPAGRQGFSGPPHPGAQRANTSGSFPGPPQSAPSFAPPPSAPPGQFDGSTPPPGLHRTSTMPTQQYADHPGSPGFPPALQSPSAHVALPSPGFAPQQYQPMAAPPPGGYSQFQYGSTSGQVPGTNPHASPHDLHQQLYRPSEQEATVVDHENPNAKPPKSNVGKRVDKVEKGVGRFLKKLDKKF
ncbi:hypothetical protein BDU57DRAFT_480812 [Ampelomyces quisqualis]|uniref:RNA recognition motif-containing protein n=1 Tax=Ampelomyces quisqualis TaxID=50730 RepID=A0A6A5QEX5_AMPQU|nr:hypothetical protein BDU57DRAFT_480812 [Ampelomyces quisqualis]